MISYDKEKENSQISRRILNPSPTEIELMFSPLSSNDLRELEEESEIMSQCQLLDSCFVNEEDDNQDEGINKEFFNKNTILNASKNIFNTQNFKKEDEILRLSKQKQKQEKYEEVKEKEPIQTPIETSPQIEKPFEEKAQEINAFETVGIKSLNTKPTLNTINNHPFRHLVHKENIDLNTFKNFIALTFRGLHFCKRCLKGQYDRFFASKEFFLPEPKVKRFKTIFIDLDETLVHSCSEQEIAQFIVRIKNEQGQESRVIDLIKVKLNFRPFVQEFLQSTSQYYEIVIFTAASFNYALMVVKLLDPQRKYISAILSREHCLVTNNGIFIKDLRIIRNRELKNMLILDNLSYSFGFQIDNGIPILGWTNDRTDVELREISDYLIEAAFMDDLRFFNRTRLQLYKMLVMKEKEIFSF